MMDLTKNLAAAVARHRVTGPDPPPPPPDGGGGLPPPPPPPSAEDRLSTASTASTVVTFTVGASHSSNWAKEEKGELRDGVAAWDKHGTSDVAEVGYAPRPMDAIMHKPGSRPIWQHAAYADLFASAYSEGSSKRQPPLISLVVCLELLGRAAGHLANECDGGTASAIAMGRVSRALSDAQKIVTRSERPHNL